MQPAAFSLAGPLTSHLLDLEFFSNCVFRNTESCLRSVLSGPVFQPCMVVLGIEPKTFWVRSTCSITEPQPLCMQTMAYPLFSLKRARTPGPLCVGLGRTVCWPSGDRTGLARPMAPLSREEAFFVPFLLSGLFSTRLRFRSWYSQSKPSVLPSFHASLKYLLLQRYHICSFPQHVRWEKEKRPASLHFTSPPFLAPLPISLFIVQQSS